MRIVSTLLVFGLLLFYFLDESDVTPASQPAPDSQFEDFQNQEPAVVSDAQSTGQNEFGPEDAGEQIRGAGTVVRLLPDDNEGSRHQRFILRLNSGQTLLVAHNIDLAPRIEGLEVNDRVEFYGEYEWNEQGGLVHWTHHDPNGRHVDGWLRSQGQTYQ